MHGISGVPFPPAIVAHSSKHGAYSVGKRNLPAYKKRPHGTVVSSKQRRHHHVGRSSSSDDDGIRFETVCDDDLLSQDLHPLFEDPKPYRGDLPARKSNKYHSAKYRAHLEGELHISHHERTRRHRKREDATALTEHQLKFGKQVPRASSPRLLRTTGGGSRDKLHKHTSSEWRAEADDTPNSFLATDVSFHLKRGLSKPGLFRKLRSKAGGRGDMPLGARFSRTYQLYRTEEKHHSSHHHEKRRHVHGYGHSELVTHIELEEDSEASEFVSSWNLDFFALYTRCLS